MQISPLIQRLVLILLVGFIVFAGFAASAQEKNESITESAQTAAENVQEDETEHGEDNGHHDARSAASHFPPIVHDLGLILIAAAVMLLLFKWLKQPVILGYLIAGFIVSPYFLPTDPTHELYESYEWLYRYLPKVIPETLSVRDAQSIEVWAEIGVIFMLFGLGLEFSFKKLLAIGRVAAISGGFEVISTTIIGFFIGRLLGWNNIDSIFFGAMLAMSSTTIILKVFDDLKLKAKPYAPIVFGALIVEDILAMLLLVMLSSIAISNTFAGGELFFSSMKLVFFLVLWLILGIFLIPLLLKGSRRFLNDELLLLISVGLCFLMVMIACGVGFSSALGAFVMGSILAETSKGSRIEHVLHPIKDLFAAVFFVSVGMMIDPVILYEHIWAILIVTVLTVVIKFWGTGFGALLAGCSIRNSVCAGLSMAQIGEFAFIIAMLGKSLNVISDFLYPVVVATSAITTLTTPYLILSAGKIAKWLDHLLPEKIALLALRYEVAMNEKIGRESVPSLFGRIHGLPVILNTVLVIAIALGTPLLFQDIHPIVLLTVAVLIASPFFWGIFRGRKLHPDKHDAETLTQLQQLQFGFTGIRFLIVFTLVIFFVHNFLTVPSLVGLTAVFCVVVFLFACSRPLDWLYQRGEARFVSHLSDKERSLVEDRATRSHLVPWEATLTQFTLSEYSSLVMKTLQDSNLKQKFGVTVAIIKRCGKDIIAPKADERLLPCDHLYLIGTYEQLAAAQTVIEYRPEHEDHNAHIGDHFGMVSLRLTPEHVFVGKAIRDCGIRESANGLVIGVERGGKRVLNPDPNMLLESGDVMWLVGEKHLLAKL